MVFSSSVFLFVFFPVVLGVYLIAKEKSQNIVLLIASLLFYAWGEPKNIFLMLLTIVINYGLGFVVSSNSIFRKVGLITALIVDLGFLFVFKYLNFTVDTVNYIAGWDVSVKYIALPIGISFYTFQIMSYIVDVYNGKVECQKNVIKLALYVSLFPQLIAGPIVRYSDIKDQIDHRTHTRQRISEGFYRFAIGFSKKILIADTLSKLVDICYAGTYPSILLNWTGAVAYTLQIYYDFSGYSDMAIGLGKIFGFEFRENFNYPYISRSIQEFWRRWHMSLSGWFRDYLYIPLGGSRCGSMRTYINLFIVFFFTGLWHGASFNFIVWGLFYAVFLTIERLGFKNVIEKLPVFFSHVYALFVIVIGWVFFRAETLTDAVLYINNMFTLSGRDFVYFEYVMNKEYWFSLIVGIVLCVPIGEIIDNTQKRRIPVIVKDILIVGVFFIAVCYMIGKGYSPFLYFRF